MVERTSFQKQSKVYHCPDSELSPPPTPGLTGWLQLRQRSWKPVVVVELPKRRSRESWKSLGGRVARESHQGVEVKGRWKRRAAGTVHRTQEPDVFPGQSPSIRPHYRPFPPQHVDWSGADGRAESCLGLWSEYCFTTFNSSPLLLPLFPPKRRGEKSYLLSYHCPL